MRTPFSNRAIGVQVPDVYSFPTATMHTRGTSTLGADAGGVAYALLTANPVLSMITPSFNVTTTSMTQYAGCTNAYAATSQATIAASFSNIRTVAYGFKINNLIAPINTTGRVIITPVVITGVAPGPNILTSGSNISAGNLMGMLTGSAFTGGIVSTGILSMPGAMEFSLQQLMNQEIQLSGRPITNSSTDFHNTQLTSALSATQDLTQNSLEATAGAPTGTEDTDAWCDWRGYEAFFIRFEGLPASATVCAEIEYIYHFEGTPATQTTGTLMSGNSPAPHVDMTSYWNIMDRISQANPIRLVNTAATAASAMFGYLNPQLRIQG